jgi:hypothetical protein
MTLQARSIGYVQAILNSPCRWAAILTLGWSIAIWNNTQAAVAWPGVAGLVAHLGHRAASMLLFSLVVMLLGSIFIKPTWFRILLTTVPLTCWMMILIEGLRFTGLYMPAVWTAIVCVLSLVHSEVRRASEWDKQRRG